MQGFLKRGGVADGERQRVHAWFAFARRAARDADRRATVLGGLPAGGLQLGLARQLHQRMFPRVAVLASFDPVRRDSFLAALMLRAQVPIPA